MPLSRILGFFRLAPPKPRLPESEIPRAFRQFRIQAFVAVYFGYGFFYLIRKNLGPAIPVITKDLSITKTSLGIVLSLFGATYALAKLVNGPICDRSNPRRFLSAGLFGAALASVGFGLSSSLLMFAVLWSVNGYFQSMGSPVGPKTMANWFSQKERGRYYSLWNTCHNVGAFVTLSCGGFLVERYGWRAGFFLPAAICLLGAVLVYLFMIDRPESVGLPSIQEYHGEVQKDAKQDSDESASEILWTYVLRNSKLWLAATSAMLVYMVRYGLSDWGASFLKEYKGAGVGMASLRISFLELVGIPGSILAGLVADRYFSNSLVYVAIIWVLGMSGATLGAFLIPPGHAILDGVAFGMAGFFIYGAQVVLTGLIPLSLVPRRAAASAVGLTGAASYIGTLLTSYLSGWTADRYGWGAVFTIWISCGAAAVVVLLPIVFLSRRDKRV